MHNFVKAVTVGGKKYKIYRVDDHAKGLVHYQVDDMEGNCINLNHIVKHIPTEQDIHKMLEN